MQNVCVRAGGKSKRKRKKETDQPLAAVGEVGLEFGEGGGVGGGGLEAANICWLGGDDESKSKSR